MPQQDRKVEADVHAAFQINPREKDVLETPRPEWVVITWQRRDRTTRPGRTELGSEGTRDYSRDWSFQEQRTAQGSYMSKLRQGIVSQ